MRDTFVRKLLEIARQDPRVVLLTGDLGFGVLTEFAQELPRQFVNVGVAEQNLIGLSTGLAMAGHVVFAYSIGNFPILRCLEQLRNDACYHNAAVKVVSVGGGFSYGSLGFSHHATEDLAIARALPNMTVLCPGDLDEVTAVTAIAYSNPGTHYIRLDKSHVSTTTNIAAEVTFGGLRRLRQGRDVVILGTGGILDEGLRAAELLKPFGIDCAVFSAHTIKPLDIAGITLLARSAQLLVTLEEHTLHGGFGSAVAEVLADAGAFPPAFRRFGLSGGFLSIVGTQSYLRQQHRLDADALVSGIREAMETTRGVFKNA